eukprot:GDKJ01023739.1.p1 GENE.GDKJ01023739.1~~GDKJ01023739.1.p1  ORF type:complete len:1403 (+),score=347.85 GDKJ01023739.1:94-4209(+)
MKSRIEMLNFAHTEVSNHLKDEVHERCSDFIKGIAANKEVDESVDKIVKQIARARDNIQRINNNVVQKGLKIAQMQIRRTRYTEITTVLKEMQYLHALRRVASHLLAIGEHNAAAIIFTDVMVTARSNETLFRLDSVQELLSRVNEDMQSVRSALKFRLESSLCGSSVDSVNLLDCIRAFAYLPANQDPIVSDIARLLSEGAQGRMRSALQSLCLQAHSPPPSSSNGDAQFNEYLKKKQQLQNELGRAGLRELCKRIPSHKLLESIRMSCAEVWNGLMRFQFLIGWFGLIRTPQGRQAVEMDLSSSSSSSSSASVNASHSASSSNRQRFSKFDSSLEIIEAFLNFDQKITDDQQRNTNDPNSNTQQQQQHFVMPRNWLPLSESLRKDILKVREHLSSNRKLSSPNLSEAELSARTSLVKPVPPPQKNEKKTLQVHATQYSSKVDTFISRTRHEMLTSGRTQLHNRIFQPLTMIISSVTARVQTVPSFSGVVPSSSSQSLWREEDLFTMLSLLQILVDEGDAFLTLCPHIVNEFTRPSKMQQVLSQKQESLLSPNAPDLVIPASMDAADAAAHQPTAIDLYPAFMSPNAVNFCATVQLHALQWLQDRQNEVRRFVNQFLEVEGGDRIPIPHSFSSINIQTVRLMVGPRIANRARYAPSSASDLTNRSSSTFNPVNREDCTTSTSMTLQRSGSGSSPGVSCFKYKVRGRLELMISKLLKGVDGFNVRNPFVSPPPPPPTVNPADGSSTVPESHSSRSILTNSSHNSVSLAAALPSGFMSLLLGEATLDKESSRKDLLRNSRDAFSPSAPISWLLKPKEGADAEKGINSKNLDIGEEERSDWAKRLAQESEFSSIPTVTSSTLQVAQSLERLLAHTIAMPSTAAEVFSLSCRLMDQCLLSVVATMSGHKALLDLIDKAPSAPIPADRTTAASDYTSKKLQATTIAKKFPKLRMSVLSVIDTQLKELQKRQLPAPDGTAPPALSLWSVVPAPFSKIQKADEVFGVFERLVACAAAEDLLTAWEIASDHILRSLDLIIALSVASSGNEDSGKGNRVSNESSALNRSGSSNSYGNASTHLRTLASEAMTTKQVIKTYFLHQKEVFLELRHFTAYYCARDLRRKIFDPLNQALLSVNWMDIEMGKEKEARTPFGKALIDLDRSLRDLDLKLRTFNGGAVCPRARLSFWQAMGHHSMISLLDAIAVLHMGSNDSRDQAKLDYAVFVLASACRQLQCVVARRIKFAQPGTVATDALKNFPSKLLLPPPGEGAFPETDPEAPIEGSEMVASLLEAHYYNADMIIGWAKLKLNELPFSVLVEMIGKVGKRSGWTDEKVKAFKIEFENLIKREVLHVVDSSTSSTNQNRNAQPRTTSRQPSGY